MVFFLSVMMGGESALNRRMKMPSAGPGVMKARKDPSLPLLWTAIYSLKAWARIVKTDENIAGPYS